MSCLGEKETTWQSIIDFTNEIDIPGKIDIFSKEGSETDFLKDFLILNIDSVVMLSDLERRLTLDIRDVVDKEGNIIR